MVAVELVYIVDVYEQGNDEGGEAWTLTRHIELPCAPVPRLVITFDDEVEAIDEVFVDHVAWEVKDQQYVATVHANPRLPSLHSDSISDIGTTFDDMVRAIESQGWSVVDRL